MTTCGNAFRRPYCSVQLAQHSWLPLNVPELIYLACDIDITASWTTYSVSYEAFAGTRPTSSTGTGRTSSRSESCICGSRYMLLTWTRPDQLQQKAKIDDLPVALYLDDSGETVQRPHPALVQARRQRKGLYPKLAGKFIIVSYNNLMLWRPSARRLLSTIFKDLLLQICSAKQSQISRGAKFV